MARAAAGFAAGSSISTGWYGSSNMRRHISEVGRRPLVATFVYTAAMARHAPQGVPFVLDMADVDSEKWFDYARTRAAAPVYALEARRFRALEIAAARRAACVLLTTAPEARLLESFAPGCRAEVVGNGVDYAYFDPEAPFTRELIRGRYLLFAGSMDYYPNAEAAAWFAREIFPELRRRDPDLRFAVVGRNPARTVRRLAELPGVLVTGTVPDMRPYLDGALAVVAPMRIARGVQNKVLEALAMSRAVFASEPVCATFGSDLPAGVARCGNKGEWIRALSSPPPPDAGIRDAARRRFCWEVQTLKLAAYVEAAVLTRAAGACV